MNIFDVRTTPSPYSLLSGPFTVSILLLMPVCQIVPLLRLALKLSSSSSSRPCASGGYPSPNTARSRKCMGGSNVWDWQCCRFLRVSYSSTYIRETFATTNKQPLVRRGNIDLPSILPFLGRTQLEVLAVICSLLLVLTHGITSYFVSEKVLLKDKYVSFIASYEVSLLNFCFEFSNVNKKSTGLLSTFADIWNNILTLPRTIRQIVSLRF
jgi:hypothetical protein